jgi:hypothetical protein
MRSNLLKHNNLMLRSERRERLEAWQQATHRSLDSQYWSIFRFSGFILRDASRSLSSGAHSRDPLAMLVRMRSETLMVRSTATPCVSNHEAADADPTGKCSRELPRRPDQDRQRQRVPSYKIVTAGYPGRHCVDATTSNKARL